MTAPAWALGYDLDWLRSIAAIFADHDAYDPPQRTVDNIRVPFKADGTPGNRCAGFDAWKRIGASR